MSELIIERQKQQTVYFTEDLGNGVGLDMVFIPGGTFLMGSPETEVERRDAEGPQVPAFFMGRYPVTQAQYEAVMGENPATQYSAKFVAPTKPVVGVSWEDATAFCELLAEVSSRPYRLPSEAEWEYACRAGTTTPFHFGETITTELANYGGSNYADASKGGYRGETTPVDFFGIANEFGLCEMHGNVWEWCADDWHNNYKGAPTDGSAWISSGERKTRRVLRGGSWYNIPRDCRSATRSNNDPRYRFNNDGFRVVCGVPGR